MDSKIKNQATLEFKLLLHCLEDSLLNSKRDEIITICSNGIDWNKFKNLTIRHKILPIVHKRIEEKYADFFPVTLFDEMKQFNFINSAHNFYFTTIFHRIIKLFDDNNIISVPLKGPVLAEELYGDISLRIFSDLDILVPWEKAFQAYSLLISEGFKPELKLNENRFQAYMKSEDHIILCTSNEKVNVELHWELSARYISRPFTMKQIENNIQESTFYGKPVYKFSSEDLLVYLCLHGSKHIWETLELLYLVANLLKTQLDWVKFIKLAKKTYCYKKLLLGLFLCSQFFTCKLPPDIKALSVNNPKIIKLADYVTEMLLKPIEDNSWDIAKSKFTKYQFSTLDRFQDKIRYLFFMVLFPTNNDWASVTVSEKYSFIYYIIRPFRLAINFIKQRNTQ